MKTRTNHGAEIALPEKQKPYKWHIAGPYPEVEKWRRENHINPNNVHRITEERHLHGLKDVIIIFHPECLWQGELMMACKRHGLEFGLLAGTTPIECAPNTECS